MVDTILPEGVIPSNVKMPVDPGSLQSRLGSNLFTRRLLRATITKNHLRALEGEAERQ